MPAVEDSVLGAIAVPALPREATGQTFRKIFGTASSSLELFLLKRNLMGPCWLKIKGVQKHSPLVRALGSIFRFEVCA